MDETDFYGSFENDIADEQSVFVQRAGLDALRGNMQPGGVYTTGRDIRDDSSIIDGLGRLVGQTIRALGGSTTVSNRSIGAVRIPVGGAQDWTMPLILVGAYLLLKH